MLGISIYVRPIEILSMVEPAVKDVFKPAETSLVVLKLTLHLLAVEAAVIQVAMTAMAIPFGNMLKGAFGTGCKTSDRHIRNEGTFFIYNVAF